MLVTKRNESRVITLLAIVMLAVTAYAAEAANRVALVIGMSKYQTIPTLANTYGFFYNKKLLDAAGVAVPSLGWTYDEMFADAANQIPLTSIGLLQYVTPIGQLLCGVLLYHEPMPPTQLLGFGLVWLALIVFTWEALRHGRRAARAARAGTQVEARPEAVYAGGSST